MARRESPADFLDRKPTRQRQQTEAPKLILPEHCEIRGCTSGKHGIKGKPEVAIHDSRSGGTLGYACQRCYDDVMVAAGKDRFSAITQGAPMLTPAMVRDHVPIPIVRDENRQIDFEQQRNARHVADILGALKTDFDRYADSMSGQNDDD